MVDLNLNSQLISNESPLTKSTVVSALDFDTQTERGAISSMHIKDFSFSQGTGGSLNLGGTNNGNGLLSLKNSYGSEITRMDKDGIYIKAGVDQAILFGSQAGTKTAMTMATGASSGTFVVEGLGNTAIRLSTEDSANISLIGAGTLEFKDIHTVVRFIRSDNGTIAELGTNGDIKIAGTLGTGISF